MISSSGRHVQYLPVSVSPLWMNFLFIMGWEWSSLFPPISELGSYWIFIYPISSVLYAAWRLSIFTKWVSFPLLAFSQSFFVDLVFEAEWYAWIHCYLVNMLSACHEELLIEFSAQDSVTCWVLCTCSYWFHWIMWPGLYVGLRGI